MKYLVEMADMGYRLTRKTVMELAFTIVQKSERKNPFRGGKTGRALFQGFRRRHPQLSLRAPQLLSYCRAISCNQATVDDCRLNLITKPMLIYNCDETGISIVYKPGKVVTEMVRWNVYALMSAEREKNIPCLLVYQVQGMSSH